MAMTMKATVALIGVGVLVIAAGLLYFGMRRLAVHYQDTNATWKIRGVCTNAQTGAPIQDAQVTATFTEPVSFKHHWRNPPPLAETNVVVKTDDQGRFEVNGEGGSAYITVQAEGYREPEPWQNWRYYTRDGISRVDTNITVRLEPLSKSAHNEKASGQ
jgi:hypothetical protein